MTEQNLAYQYVKFCSIFMIFFPTVMEGPICRYSDVKEQLFQGKPITEDAVA
jgi:D-alanyl-lipoteichoic acid acyltransferase DltB (MBOAT superfamily)